MNAILYDSITKENDRKLIIYFLFNEQMRYQQKVMQENAQKKSDLYGYDDTQQKLLTSSLGAGKVSLFS